MLKRLLTAAIFSLSCCVCHAQTPNAVPMVPDPFPESYWHIYIWGFYGHHNYETNMFVRDSVDLRSSRFVGMVGDEDAEWGIARGYTWGASKYDIQVITDLEVTKRFALEFRLLSEESPFGFGEDDEWAKHARRFHAYARVKGQPVGFRFFEKNKSEPFKEVMYEDPGEPPKLWMMETVFVPRTDRPPPAPGMKRTSLAGEGIDGGVLPKGATTDRSTDISYDGGATWKGWRGLGKQVFPPEQLAQNPHPIIKVTAYHRMRRYVKYYTYKKGFSDAPGGPYEPTTLEELQEQENRKKLEDTMNSLKSVEDGGTEDTTDHVKTIADESNTKTTADRTKAIIDKNGADGDE